MATTEDIIQGDLLAALPRRLAEERFDTLLNRDGVTIERIVSTGQATAAGEWLDQAWEEWVLVVAGAAEILFSGDDAPRRLTAGDYLLIPARARHRVTWTAPDQPTVWLAVHIGKPAD